jgi:tRNA A-37 threonylcarbamoyl transferase component Bud32
VPIVCPYCGRGIKLKSAKPGRYTPRCGKCGRPFVLTVPADPHDTVAVMALAVPAAPPPQAVPAAEPQPAPREVPETLGGYQILRELGRGGMGTVYLARQMSLDRKVALKVMKPQWANDPTFMARFTREAFAAAQLVHHNIVQIYDIGSDRGVHYFSMEYVEGQSLGDLLRKQGALTPEVAVGYVLQAARGLKYGHDRGMVHRDVKPDNLLLNDQGVVKVADLGLVKTPGAEEPAGQPVALPADADSQLTRAHTAVGTPAYMAPEQARDSSHVDARADVYSLGCTLYVLVTGRPPFQGGTALEVITKHAFEAVVPPDAVSEGVPKALSDIIVKMVAKKPAERHADMGEVIAALEGFLGVQRAGELFPRDEHAALLEQCVRRFNDVPAARRRSRLLLGFLAGCALLVPLCAWLGRWLLAAGFANLLVLTPLAYVLIRGYSRRTYLFARARELILESRASDWLAGLGVGVVFVGLLALFGLLGPWLGCCAVAVAVALGFYLLVDRPLAEERGGSVEEVEQMLRSMRLRGLDEERLREFVCKYSGERWEEFYEALFGYEAKLRARARWGEVTPGRPRERYAAWREPVLAWVDSRLRARREARERQVLRTAEQKGLEAQGVSEAEAGARAEQAADVLVARAAALKQESGPAWREGQPLPNVSDLLQMPAAPPTPPVPPARRWRREVARRLGGALYFVLGPRVRLLVGLVLVAGCAGWLYQNGLVPGQEIKQAADDAINRQDVPDVTPLQNFDWFKETKPLGLPPVPAALTDVFASLNPGVAGLILVLSALLHGPRITLFGWAGALLALAGPWLGVPALGPVTASEVSMAAGVLLAVPGFVP